MKILLWDIDGTILLAGGAGKVAFNRVFEELYQEYEIWENYKPDGKTDYLIINDIYSKRFGKLPTQEEVQNIKNLYAKHLDKTLYEENHFRVLPFAEEVLNAFSKRDDVVMALCTGNFKDTSFSKMKRAKLENIFSFGGFGCDSIDRKELTRLAFERATIKAGKNFTDVYVIGDTIHDVNCAKSIGAISVAVATGSTKPQTLKEAGAHIILNNLGEFPDL